MTTYDDVAALADQLTLSEKARLIEYLSASLRRTLESEAYKRMDWHEFLRATYGILADDPIERAPQPPLEEREPIE